MLAIDDRTARALWAALAPHYVDLTYEGLDYERDQFLDFCAAGCLGDYWPVTVFAVGPSWLDRLRRRRYLYQGRLIVDEEGDLVLDTFRKESGTWALMNELNRELKRLQEPVTTKPYRRKRLSPLAGRLSG